MHGIISMFRRKHIYQRSTSQLSNINMLYNLWSFTGHLVIVSLLPLLSFTKKSRRRKDPSDRARCFTRPGVRRRPAPDTPVSLGGLRHDTRDLCFSSLSLSSNERETRCLCEFERAYRTGSLIKKRNRCSVRRGR